MLSYTCNNLMSDTKLKIKLFFTAFFLFAFLGVLYTLHITASWNIHVVTMFLYFIVAYFFTKYWIELPYKGWYSGSSIPILLASIDIGLWFSGILCVVTSVCSFLIYRTSLRAEALNLIQYWVSLTCTAILLNWIYLSFSVESIWVRALCFILASILFEFIAFVIVSLYDWAESNKPLSWTDVYEYAKNSFVPVLLSISLIPWPYINLHFDYVYYWISLAAIIGMFIVFRHLFNAFNQLRMKTNSLVESIGDMVDLKTNQNHHAIQVGKISVLIGEKVGLSPKELDELFQAATLHDIGKTALLDHLWKRRGKFTIDEENEYRKHVQKGAEFIRSIKGMELMSTIILHQHEHFDGTGFPDGLKGEEIPLYSRIIRIASRIDRLLSRSLDQNLYETLLPLAGKELDPNLVEVCKALDVKDLYLTPYTSPSMETHDFLSEIKKELYSSELAEHFHDLQILIYSQGVLQSIEGGAIQFPLESFRRCIEEALKTKETKRDLIRLTNQQVYGLTCVPMGDGVLLIIHKLSEVLKYEQTQKQLLRNIYKDVLHAATQGKLEILDREEFQHRFFDFTLPDLIRTKEDIALARQPFMSYLQTLSLSKEKKMQILLCVNEALTNIIKHAELGRCGFRRKDHILEYSVSDNGNGIDLASLPKSTLLKGFSTQYSMGHGFKLMIQYCDKIVLCTGEQGTSMVMQFQLTEQEI
jgi:anti-sigma regulatory factor (Ser/Thr protein kinase)/Txe/YoeB family toxin of Txe-Axe toxin-antitoxin module